MILPAISTIEFTNACNFSCSYCQRTDEDGKRKVGMLSVELVERMIIRGDFSNTMYCEFQQNGEPTIHPKFPQLVDMIKRAVPYIGLSTNGTFHKFKNHEAVLAALRKCSCVTLSIHAETTQQDVDLMVSGLRNHTKLRIQTLDNNKYNLDIPSIDGVYIDNYEIREFGKYYAGDKQCLDPITSVTVQHDGDVVACCNVVGKQRVYGNLHNNSMEEIWSTAEKIMFSYCNTCRTPNPYIKRLNFLAETLNA